MRARVSALGLLAIGAGLATGTQPGIVGIGAPSRDFNSRDLNWLLGYSGRKSTNWLAKLNGNTNGEREKSRRVRQMEKGMLHA